MPYPQQPHARYDEPAPGPSLFSQVLTGTVYFLLVLAVGVTLFAIVSGGLVTIEDSPAAVPSAPQPTAAPTARPQPSKRPVAAPASVSQPIPLPPGPQPLQPGEIWVLQTPTPAIFEMVATVVIPQPPIATDTPPWIVGEPGTFPPPADAPIPPFVAEPPVGTEFDSQCGGDNPPLVCATGGH